MFLLALMFNSQAQALSLCLFGLGWNCDDEADQQALKKALVIGNADYSFSPLKNPINDAKDMAKKLKSLGFEVNLLLNANEEQMGQAISEMGKTYGGVEIFYYAGHGVAIEKKNYLLPVNQKFFTENSIKYNAIDVAYVLDEIKGKDKKANKLSILILDACRDNPLKNQSSRSIGNKQGLAPITKTIPGSMIMYSASANQIAYDGDGRNGVFTGHLLEEIGKPDVEIETMFKHVSRLVEKHTKGKQVPERVYTFTGNYQIAKTIVKPKIDVSKLLKNKGKVIINSSPSGALLLLEGHPLGKTPYQLEISPGRYHIDLAKKGYQLFKKDIVIQKNKKKQKNFELIKKR